VSQYLNATILDCTGARMMEMVVTTGAKRHAKVKSYVTTNKLMSSRHAVDKANDNAEIQCHQFVCQ